MEQRPTKQWQPASIIITNSELVRQAQVNKKKYKIEREHKETKTKKKRRRRRTVSKQQTTIL